MVHIEVPRLPSHAEIVKRFSTTAISSDLTTGLLAPNPILAIILLGSISETLPDTLPQFQNGGRQSPSQARQGH